MFHNFPGGSLQFYWKEKELLQIEGKKKIKDYLINLVKISFAMFKITAIDFLIRFSSFGFFFKTINCMNHSIESFTGSRS